MVGNRRATGVERPGDRRPVETVRDGLPDLILVEQHIGFALRAAARYYVIESGRVTSTGDGGEAAAPAVRAALTV